MDIAKLARRYRISDPKHFRLADCDTTDTCDLDIDKEDAKALLSDTISRMADLQERLWASDRRSVLIVLQAMDAAGKDGVIKHVMTGINPQGCEVHAFKQPSAEELDHDFLWRVGMRAPQRGRIGIFNRSHYEEVLVVRVHPDYIKAQRLPPALISEDGVPDEAFWDKRFKSIRGFERHLARSGTVVLKFFLNVSREEQRRRFLDRLEEPGKRWKFSMGDVTERKLWDSYMDAYESAIRETSRKKAPWFVVPADNKWFTRLVVAAVIVDALEQLDLQFPTVSEAALKDMEAARRALEREQPRNGERRKR